MSKVVSLAERKEKEAPRSTGKAICMLCGHEQVSVAPTGVTWMECANCHSMKSHFIYPCERDGEQWKCDCGNNLFHVKPEGYYCPNCGEWQNGF
jgi:hypothetical protein